MTEGPAWIWIRSISDWIETPEPMNFMSTIVCCASTGPSDLGSLNFFKKIYTVGDFLSNRVTKKREKHIEKNPSPPPVINKMFRVRPTASDLSVKLSASLHKGNNELDVLMSFKG